MSDQVKSVSANQQWVDNILENIRNLEAMERLAREGCSSILEYVQVPFEQRKVQIADVQYKNLRLMVNELLLLLTDASPKLGIDKVQPMRDDIKTIVVKMSERKLFVKEKYSQGSQQIIDSTPTQLFYITLEYVCELRFKIINMLTPLLFVKEENPYISHG